MHPPPFRTPDDSDPIRAAELAARDAYGKILALLSKRTGDIASAEDALSEAFVSALTSWPRLGVPDSPEAWLITAARRELIDAARRQPLTRSGWSIDGQLDDLLPRGREPSGPDPADSPGPFAGMPDERLTLLLVCAHPAIDPVARTPLLLQAVLGLSAERIAGAFLCAPAAMGQRLVRAKTKIRDARLRFEPPEPAELGARLADVLQAIYAAFTAGGDPPEPGVAGPSDLAADAIWLARLLVRLAPDQPEPLGLLALLLFSHARRDARRDAQGRYVPLPRQDVGAWDHALIAEADALLPQAASLGKPGRFQLEAAIQSAHVDFRRRGAAQPEVIVALYRALLACSPTVGAAVACAAALGEAGRPGEGLTLLEGIDPKPVADHQPFWAVRAGLLARAGQAAAASAAFDRAIALAVDPAVREFLIGERVALALR